MRILNSILAAALALAAAAPMATGAQALTRLEKTFGGWKVECTEPENGKKGCVLQYALVTKKTNQPVFAWTLVRDNSADAGKGAVKAVMRTPTGVLLTDGVNIGFEGADAVKIDYLTCGPRACVAEFDFTDQWLKALGQNDKVIVTYKAANEKQLKHEIGLQNFGDAFAFFKSQTASK